jgi:hypothetical protein
MNPILIPISINKRVPTQVQVTRTSTPNFYPTRYPHNTGFDVLSLQNRFKVHLNELVLEM